MFFSTLAKQPNHATPLKGIFICGHSGPLASTTPPNHSPPNRTHPRGQNKQREKRRREEMGREDAKKTADPDGFKALIEAGWPTSTRPD